MVKIFDGFTPIEKKKVLKLFEANILKFDKDVSVLSKLTNANKICILKSGSAHILRTDYDGNETIIEKLLPEAVFGTKMMMLDNNEYDLITTEESEFIFIDYDYVINKNNKNVSYYQKFIINMLDIISDKILEQNKRISILTKKSTREKLLEYFREESNKQFSRNLYLPFNLTELAEYLSVDRSAMMREIKRLREDKIIESSGKHIRLLI